ncbi:MAG: hypothetical protein HY610_01345, partial [Elusimicrobia bacterium]|nr:hypothetical protein [Elusimicrobiota bacterium]
MKKSLVLLQIVGFAFVLAGCGPSSNLFVRDAALAKKTKKVVLLPFQWANNRASEDPSYEG